MTSFPNSSDEPDLLCPVLLLLDASGAIAGEPYERLQAGLEEFAEHLRRDPLASNKIEVGVYAFGGTDLEFYSFEPAADFFPPEFSVKATAPVGAALTAGLDAIEGRVQQLEGAGTICYQPWIFLISAGAPTDEWSSAAERIREAAEEQRIFFFAIGVGDADMELLNDVAPGRRARKLAELDFSKLFRWIADILIRVSHSSYGDTIKLPVDNWSEKKAATPQPDVVVPTPPVNRLPPLRIPEDDWDFETPLDPGPKRPWWSQRNGRRLGGLMLLLVLSVVGASAWWFLTPDPPSPSPSEEVLIPQLPSPLPEVRSSTPTETAVIPTTPAPASLTSLCPAKSVPRTHKVQVGDSLSAIARCYPGLTLEDLWAANDMPSGWTRIYPGQELKLRPGVAESQPLRTETKSESRLAPLAVLLDNTGGYPQAGLSKASAVYEMPVEGGATRLMAIYDRPLSDRVGPVRSARDYFLDMAQQLGGTLVHDGGSPSALTRIEKDGVRTLNANSEMGALFSRAGGRTAPYNLYAGGDGLRRAADQLRPGGARTVSGVIYKPNEAAGSVEGISVSYSSIYSSGFTYVTESGRYRWQRNGQDASDEGGQPVLVDAVVVIKVESTVIPGDTDGRLYMPLRGGDATLYIRGKEIPGSWSLTKGLHFADGSGNEVGLELLTHWVLFAPTSADVAVVPQSPG